MSTKTYTFSDELISDLHKDALGFRPNWDYYTWWNTCTDDEKQAEWDSLVDAMERNMQLEREEQERASEDFIRTIGTLRGAGATSFEMALRWLHEAHATNGDDEYLEYLLNLPFGYISKVQRLNGTAEQQNIPTWLA
jgi:hypothetical protein